MIENIEERIKTVTEKFTKHNDWEDRYREVIVLGKSISGLEEDDKVEKFRIKGCQSQVWLKPKFESGCVHFLADSDAILVKGIIGLLLNVYSGATPEDILKTPANFLTEIGISEHLSMNRTNGLASMVKQIQMYASMFKALKDKGVMDANL